MQFLTLLPLLATAFAVLPETPGLDIDYTLTHTCQRKSQKGDTIYAHYLGTLATTGAKFDSSYDRNSPFSFRLGQGQVIKGWDLGLLDMCPGDKRTLIIAPELGYGQRSMGPIPAGSTLVFKTELVSIQGVPEEPKVVAPVEGGADAVDPVPEATPEPEAEEVPVATESPEPLETPSPEAKQEL